MQVIEEFFTRPTRKMAKSRSKPRSPVPSPHKEAKNVYEDSDTDNSDIEILKGGDSGGHRYGGDSGRRQEKRRRTEYDSDRERFRSPPPRRREGRRSPPSRFTEDRYRRKERRERAEEGPSSSRVKKERSITPEGYHRENRGHSGNDRSYEDDRGRQYSWYSWESPRRETPRREDRPRRLHSVKVTPECADADQVRSRVNEKKNGTLKKPVEVDAFGIPVGTMKDQFHRDINAFVKEMNPCLGYEKQKQQAKDRLQDRIYAEYDVHGDADRVDEKYIKKCVTAALITWRHSLNKAVDMGEKKPPELNDRFWEELTQIRKSEASKKKSVFMGNQARNRGLRNSTKDKIRQAAIVKLVSDYL
jgi:hypothetical protein